MATDDCTDCSRPRPFRVATAPRRLETSRLEVAKSRDRLTWGVGLGDQDIEVFRPVGKESECEKLGPGEGRLGGCRRAYIEHCSLHVFGYPFSFLYLSFLYLSIPGLRVFFSYPLAPNLCRIQTEGSSIEVLILAFRPPLGLPPRTVSVTEINSFNSITLIQQARFWFQLFDGSEIESE